MERSRHFSRNSALSACSLALLFLRSVNIVYADPVTVAATDSAITYVGTWITQNGGEYRYTAESTAYANFTFKGSSISWFADRDPNGGVADVFFDGKDVATVDVSAGLAPGSATQIAALYNQTGIQGDAQHTITIRYGGGSQGIYITLFHFVYDSTILNGSSTGTPGASGPTGSPISTSTATLLPLPSPTSQADQTSHGSSRHLAGPIAGGVIGGLFLVCALFLCWFVVRYARPRKCGTMSMRRAEARRREKERSRAQKRHTVTPTPYYEARYPEPTFKEQPHPVSVPTLAHLSSPQSTDLYGTPGMDTQFSSAQPMQRADSADSATDSGSVPVSTTATATDTPLLAREASMDPITEDVRPRTPTKSAGTSTTATATTAATRSPTIPTPTTTTITTSPATTRETVSSPQFAPLSASVAESVVDGHGGLPPPPYYRA